MRAAYLGFLALVLGVWLSGCTEDFDSLFAGTGASGGTASGGTAATSSGGTAATSSGGTAGNIGGSAGIDASLGGQPSGGAGGATDASADSYYAAVRLDEPIAYFRLGEQLFGAAKDEIGNYSGVYQGDAQVKIAGALKNDPDTAARFVLKDSRVLVNDEDAILDFPGKHPFTLEAWVKLDSPLVPSALGRYHLISKKDDSLSTDQQRGYLLFFNASYDGGNGPFQFQAQRKVSDAATNVTSQTITSFSEYHYVVAVFDGTNLKLYIDNNLEQSHASPESLDDTTVPLTLGNSIGGSQWLSGSLDEVAIYDKVLPESRIQVHYQLGRGF